MRPYFVAYHHMRLYHVLTFLATRVMMAYLVFPFVALEWGTSIQVYRELYYFGYILAVAAIFVLPQLVPKYKAPEGKTKSVAETPVQSDGEVVNGQSDRRASSINEDGDQPLLDFTLAAQKSALCQRLSSKLSQSNF